MKKSTHWVLSGIVSRFVLFVQDPTSWLRPSRTPCNAMNLPELPNCLMWRPRIRQNHNANCQEYKFLAPHQTCALSPVNDSAACSNVGNTDPI
jgi:hypothetical protein